MIAIGAVAPNASEFVTDGGTSTPWQFQIAHILKWAVPIGIVGFIGYKLTSPKAHTPNRRRRARRRR